MYNTDSWLTDKGSQNVHHLKFVLLYHVIYKLIIGKWNTSIYIFLKNCWCTGQFQDNYVIQTRLTYSDILKTISLQIDGCGIEKLSKFVYNLYSLKLVI